MVKEFEYPLEIQEDFLKFIEDLKQFREVSSYNEKVLFSTSFDSDKYPFRMYHIFDKGYDPKKDRRNNRAYKVYSRFPVISHVGFRRNGDQYKPLYINVLGEVSWPEVRTHFDQHPKGDQLYINFENAFVTSCEFRIRETKLNLTYKQDGSELIQIKYNGVEITPEVAEAIGLVIPEQFDVDNFTGKLFHPETLADPINAPVGLDKWKFGDLIKASGVRLPIK